MTKILSLIISLLFPFTLFALRDCPADQVLWRQQNSSHSDCKCPNGSSFYTTPNSFSPTVFGRCTDSTKNLSTSWAKDIDSNIALWLDAYDPYNIGYIPTTAFSYSNWTDKSYYAYNSTTGAASSGSNVTHRIINPSASSPTMPNYSFSFTGSNFFNRTTTSHAIPTSITFFIVFNYSSAISSNTGLVKVQTNNGNFNLYYKSATNLFTLQYNGVGSADTATISSSTAPLTNSKQIAVGIVDSNATMYLALLNSGTGYTPSFSSAGSYVYKTNISFTGTNNTSYTGIDVVLANCDSSMACSKYSGNINEFILYNTKLSDSNIDLVLQSLNKKWAVY